ncbi:MAG TPA: preprotein translocase subunit YajC [Acidimicrobiales bacterium]
MGLLLILLLFVLFWAFLIRPKQREMRRHQELVASLDVGDEVMTGSGFYGVITELEGDIVRIELAPGLEVKMARRAIAAKVVEGEDVALLGPLEPDEDAPLDDEIVDAELVEDDEVEVIEPLEDVGPDTDPADDDSDRPDGENR